MRTYLPIVVMTASTTLYYLGQRCIPDQVHPLRSLAVNYGTALLGTLLLLVLLPGEPRMAWTQSFNWASVVVGISIIGVELGVLLAYRAGWKISLVSILGETASALLLIAVGIALFREQVSQRSLLGMALSLAGLVLIAQGGR